MWSLLKWLAVFFVLLTCFSDESSGWWRRRRRRRRTPCTCSWRWGSCSRSCGRGIQSAVRTSSCPNCNLPKSKSCYIKCCKVDCRWGSWNSWGRCSRTCGTGIKNRIRSYRTPSRCGGSSCVGSRSQTTSCTNRCCKVDCRVGSWSAFSSCSRSCGGGTQRRTRSIIVRPTCRGARCASTVDARSCNNNCCPVDCQWGKWSNFSLCSASCDGGKQTRSRKISLVSRCGGETCLGPNEENKACNTDCCQVNCEWSTWSEFGNCSVPCGGGRKKRTRSIATMASCGGTSCRGFSENEELCNPDQCQVVDCVWSEWGNWSECSASCGSGYQMRSRKISTASLFGGVDCEGSRHENRTCNKGCCPVDCTWRDWGEWYGCSSSCGPGMQLRIRTILTEKSCGGNQCKGKALQKRDCESRCCSIDCAWNEWSRWESCSVTCGAGSQLRRRTMFTKESCGGEKCAGSSNETRGCNEQCCPVNCTVSSWSEWTKCTATCGSAGFRMRQRNITANPECGGEICPEEELSEVQKCNQFCYNGGQLTSTSCNCTAGWSGGCCSKDIDECKTSMHNCTGDNMTCKNTVGSFSCTCGEFLVLKDGKCVEEPPDIL